MFLFLLGKLKIILNDCDCVNCVNLFVSVEGRKLKIKNIGVILILYIKLYRGVEE